jgi:zinc/manganese transport system substrate-binding protein
VTDPHAWNSAANGALYAQNILNGLVKADPEDKAALEAPAALYRPADSRSTAGRKRSLRHSAGKRKVLTSHDAFGYFGRAYGVTFGAAGALFRKRSQRGAGGGVD